MTGASRNARISTTIKSHWRAIAPPLLAAALALGCGGDADPAIVVDTPAACNPLGGQNCITPFPSSIYERDDAESATGRRIDIPVGALPVNFNDVGVDPAPYNARDGFSPAAPILAVFPGGIDPSPLASSRAIGDSLLASSPTVILDMTTGERVAHFAELDAAGEGAPSQQALFLRPAVRLSGGHRYAVAVRTSLTAPDGSELDSPAGFSAILAGTSTEHALLERARPRYQDIFAALEADGVPRDDLVVAWDFTVATDDTVRRDMLAARDAAIPLMGERGQNLTYSILDEEAQPHPLVRRKIHGEFDAPLLLTDGGAFETETMLIRDGVTGLPTADGLYRTEFWSIVPECAYSAPEPVGIMLYGHGLLGSGEQATGGDVRGAADAVCRVVVGIDMRGMSTDDLSSVAGTLTNINNLGLFEQQVQGLVNHIALQHIARGPLAETLWVDEQGASLVNADDVVYYGLSQGHIFGTTFFAYDDYITRAVVGVGGGNYSMMLERSTNWATYSLILSGAYRNVLDQAIALSLIQIHWDVTDPSGVVNSILNQEIPGAAPGKQMLLHMGHADEQVPNLSTAWQARSMGIPLLGPAPYDIFGLETATGPLDSALVIFHGGVDDPPAGNIAPPDTDSHYVTRQQPAAWRQMAHFYATGEIVNECNGPCMCAEGACE